MTTVEVCWTPLPADKVCEVDAATVAGAVDGDSGHCAAVGWFALPVLPLPISPRLSPPQQYRIGLLVEAQDVLRVMGPRCAAANGAPTCTGALRCVVEPSPT